VPQPITPNLNLPLGQGAPTPRRASEDPRTAARRAFFEVALQAQTSAVAPASPAVSLAQPSPRPAPMPQSAEPEPLMRYARPGSVLDIWV
jgi:hypothetical protein